MNDRFVIVHRTYDPIHADLLGDLLRDAGIAARVTGTRSGAAIGVGQNILEVHIAVPELQAGQATDFLEAYFASEGELDAELAAAAGVDADDEEERAAEQERPERLSPLLAAGTAFVTFGVGHVYARRPWTAAALAAGQLVAMALLFGGDSWDEWTTGVTLLGGIVACDLVGAVLAAGAYNRGVRRGRGFQLASGVACAGAALGLALAVGPALADPSRGPRAEERGHARPGADQVSHPLERDPSFPPLTSQHPANPQAH